jgi:hypothetical protein
MITTTDVEVRGAGTMIIAADAEQQRCRYPLGKQVVV